MNRPAGSTGDVARSAGSAAAKGALLIGIAVLIGVFLLQQVDSDATSSAKSPATSSKPKTTTTKRVSPTTPKATTTTAPAAPAKTPAELKIVVLNAGTVAGGAKVLQTKLVTAGYANEQDAGDWPGPDQTGKSVLCKPGLDREAVALTQQAALQGSKTGAWPSPVPSNVKSDVDCIVLVGK
jgi:hypothetical protein